MKEIENIIENLQNQVLNSLKEIAKLRIEAKALDKAAESIQNLDADFFLRDAEMALEEVHQAYITLYANLISAGVEEKLNNLDF